MAADTKRGAVPEYIEYTPYWLHLPRMRRLLAAQGLHVVTDADKAVLDAASQATTDELEVSAEHHGGWREEFALAELARRGLK